MPRVEHTDDELWILDALERTAWLEVARRRAQQVEPDAVQALVALRNEMQAFFELQCSRWEDDASHGADLIFDTVQFDNGLSAAHESQQQVLSEALERYGELVHQVGTETSYAAGFKWSDFSTFIDIRQLHTWWASINRADTRKHLGTERGRFSHIGAPRLKRDPMNSGVVEKTWTIRTLPLPTRVPMRVHRDGLEVISTEQYDIRVNDHMLTNKLLLIVDLDKPIPSMRRVEGAIHSVHGLVRANRNYEQLAQGIVSDDLRRTRGDFDNNPMRLHLTPPQELQIVKAHNSVDPLLRGLCAFVLAPTEN